MNITVCCADEESPRYWSTSLFKYYNGLHSGDSNPPRLYKDQCKVKVSGIDNENLIISFRPQDIYEAKEGEPYLIWRSTTINNTTNGVAQLASMIAQLYFYGDR